jgi:hypothetical protein
VLPRWLVIALAILISIAWAVNLTVGIIYPGRSDPYLNGIFALVVGAAFTVGAGKAAVDAARRKASQALKPDEEDEDRGGRS